mgnify:CR=1 FL=1
MMYQVCGNIGSATRLDFTTIGPAVSGIRGPIRTASLPIRGDAAPLDDEAAVAAARGAYLTLTGGSAATLTLDDAWKASLDGMLVTPPAISEPGWFTTLLLIAALLLALPSISRVLSCGSVGPGGSPPGAPRSLPYRSLSTSSPRPSPAATTARHTAAW